MYYYMYIYNIQFSFSLYKSIIIHYMYRFTCESPVKNVKSSIRSSIRVPLSNRTDMMNSMKQDSDHVMGKPPIGKEKKLSVAGTPVTVCLGPVPSAPQKPQPSPKLDRPSPNPNEVTSLEVDRLWLSYTLERYCIIMWYVKCSKHILHFSDFFSSLNNNCGREYLSWLMCMIVLHLGCLAKKL